jgi:hypothetical protein
MALNLKNPRTLDAIDAVARITGESKSQAVASAIEARLAELIAAREAVTATGGEPGDRLRTLLADTSARFARAGRGADPQGRFADLTADLCDAAGMPR